MAVLKTLTKLWISIYLNRSTYSLEESLKIENNENQNKQNWKKDKLWTKEKVDEIKVFLSNSDLEFGNLGQRLDLHFL